MTPLNQWLSYARKFAEYKYCYAPLVDDNIDDFVYLAEDGFCVEDAVTKIATELELNTLDPITMHGQICPLSEDQICYRL